MAESVLAGTATFVVRQDGAFILVRRAKKGTGNGQWSCSGGTLELGETWQDCAIRETGEELGLTVSSPRLLAVTTGAVGSRGWVTIWTRCSYQGGEVALNYEASDWIWAECRDLEHIELWGVHWTPLLESTGGPAGLERMLRWA
jgi:8-oxo-dGTP diphosphatase